ncbi:MAG: hypothetical protein JKY96_03055 [Phycisphaerales bacterium]|nr:hypothetical protein [Phycisphaerales bacterium]
MQHRGDVLGAVPLPEQRKHLELTRREYIEHAQVVDLPDQYCLAVLVFSQFVKAFGRDLLDGRQDHRRTIGEPDRIDRGLHPPPVEDRKHGHRGVELDRIADQA